MDGEQQRHGNNTRLDQTEDWNRHGTKEELIKSLQKDLAQQRVSLSERVFNQETISAHKHLKQQKQGEERHRPSNRLSKGTQTSWTTLELLINMTTWRSGRKRQGREQGQMRHRRCAISSRNAGRARDSINSKPPASLLRWEIGRECWVESRGAGLLGATTTAVRLGKGRLPKRHWKAQIFIEKKGNNKKIDGTTDLSRGDMSRHGHAILW